MMTCVSLRSGVASSGSVTMAHQPAMQAKPISESTASLCFTEKSMIRLIMAIYLPPASWAGGVIANAALAITGRELGGVIWRDEGALPGYGDAARFACMPLTGALIAFPP